MKDVFRGLILVFALQLTGYADLTITQTDELGTIQQIFKGSKSATLQDDETIVLNYKAKTLLHIHRGLGIYCESGLDNYREEMLQYARSVHSRMMDASVRELMNEGYSREEAETFLQQMMNNVRQNPFGEMLLTVKEGEKTVSDNYLIQQYVIVNGDQPMAEMWISADLKKRINKESGVGVAEQFDAVFREIFMDIQQASGMEPEANPLDAAMDKLREKGYVVFERELYEAMDDQPDAGAPIPRIEISQAPVSDEIFLPPTGLRKVDVIAYMTEMERWTNEELTDNENNDSETLADSESMNSDNPVFTEPCGGLDMSRVHAPADIEQLLGPSNVSGFQRQSVKTCMHNKGVNMFGVKIPPSGVQSALYTKNQSEAIYLTLTLAVPDTEMVSEEPVAGSGIETVIIGGFSGTHYSYVQPYQGRQEKITLNMSPQAKLEIEYSCLAGTKPTVDLKIWIERALVLSRYANPVWMNQ